MRSNFGRDFGPPDFDRHFDRVSRIAGAAILAGVIMSLALCITVIYVLLKIAS